MKNIKVFLVVSLIAFLFNACSSKCSCMTTNDLNTVPSSNVQKEI